LTIGDVGRKIGIAPTTSPRGRQRHDPVRIDTDRRGRELELEVERLQLLVAERRLDKPMLSDLAPKKG
jgi:hypothetical protein